MISFVSLCFAMQKKFSSSPEKLRELHILRDICPAERKLLCCTSVSEIYRQKQLLHLVQLQTNIDIKLVFSINESETGTFNYMSH